MLIDHTTEAKSVFERGPSALKICSEGSILGQVVPLNHIFLRDCYRQLFDQIWESLGSYKGVTVSGTSGTGKSLFGILCLIEILRRMLNKEQKSFLYGKSLADVGQLIYQRTDESGACFHYIIDPENLMEIRDVQGPYAGRTATFIVLDGPGPFPDDGKCPVLWLTSPSPFLASSIAKNYLVQLFMPSWTTEELVECWKLGCSSQSVFENGAHWRIVPNEETDNAEDDDPVSNEGFLRRWIAVFGPIPRHVFGPLNAMGLVKSNRVIRSKLTTQQDILDIVKGKLEPSPALQPLMSMAVSHYYYGFVYTPITLKIGRKILEVLIEEEREKRPYQLRFEASEFPGKILKGMAERWSIRDIKLSKNWFLPCVEQLLLSRGEDHRFKLRNLKTGEKITVTLPQRALARGANEKNYGGYYEAWLYTPKTPELLAVDFWSTDMLFRCAVTLEAPIAATHPHLLKLREALCRPPRDSSPFKFVFVVPKRLEPEFELQPLLGEGGWNDLEQFVLGV